MPAANVAPRNRRSRLLEFGKGALLSLVVNALTILGWYYLGPWLPAAGNVLLALIVLLVYGLEDQWSLPLGYWAVQLVAFILWIDGLGLMMSFGSSGGGQ
ncbi:MAG: hypothetical protein ACM3XM_18820 [Mycobacterium leprae]